MSERIQVIICAIIIAVIAIWLPFYQAETSSLLDQYDYYAQVIWQEPWRFFTAHIFHLDTTHAVTNAIALVIVTVFFAHHYTVRTWFNAVIVIMVICTTVVWLLGTPERFVGLSALIHGLLLTSLLLEWSQQNYARTDWLSPLVIGLLVLKVLLEMMGAMHSAILLSAGSDYGYIHLAGLAGGIIAWRLHRKRLASLTA
ncbi:rhomboid family GlyGly-CTERM serine protease [Pseudidiomarina maritima]|jgi:rhomboid family GlyGly-CTERM serine protease|uniref:Rhomboid family GlyGly-CTERM serine protease n=1 Tax=Pseudidiomarina maritima TaxID=519453 RepID=A0A1I6GBR1_9GAMM|nr:rhomboid family intramembrane serine protease [Pseudidiomarina maritima]SFR39619.1 rhomboid family GlyGly-CTERM serine protease [Pseudidiomarina maritima]